MSHCIRVFAAAATAAEDKALAQTESSLKLNILRLVVLFLQTSHSVVRVAAEKVSCFRT